MNYCWKKGCNNLIWWRDITEEWAFCNNHAESSGPEVQLNLRHVNTGEPYLEPDDPEDSVDYDNPSLVGPQEWPPLGALPPVEQLREDIEEGIQDEESLILREEFTQCEIHGTLIELGTDCPDCMREEFEANLPSAWEMDGWMPGRI